MSMYPGRGCFGLSQTRHKDSNVTSVETNQGKQDFQVHTLPFFSLEYFSKVFFCKARCSLITFHNSSFSLRNLSSSLEDEDEEILGAAVDPASTEIALSSIPSGNPSNSRA